jgi:hypothetical protein
MTAPDSAKLHAARIARTAAFIADMKAKHDAIGTPAAEAADVRRKLLASARRSLQQMHGEPALKRVIGIILDELETRQ